jgi:hypothetical protein
MAANTAPIFSLIPRVVGCGSVVGPSANTATDGTGANSYLIFSAESSALGSGSFVNKVIFKPVGTVAATVARIFYCSDIGSFTGGTTNTTANSSLIAEVTLAAWTASNTTASPQVEVGINFPLPVSTKLFVTFGTSTGAAGNGYNPTVIGGDYE